MVLPVLPAAGVPGLHVHPLHYLLDAVLAWWLCLEWQYLHVQLAPSAYGCWHGGILRRWKNTTRPYNSLPSEAVFANSTGMLVVAFGLLVLYILLASSWKRPEPGILTDRQPLLHDGE